MKKRRKLIRHYFERKPGYKQTEKSGRHFTLHFKRAKGNADDAYVLVERSTGKTIELSWENIADIQSTFRDFPKKLNRGGEWEGTKEKIDSMGPFYFDY